jgi:aminoglycoside 6-adenylyltransferase
MPTPGSPDEAAVLEKLVALGQLPEVRALILTSTRAREPEAADDMSDFDVIVAVAEPDRFASDESWQSRVGRPLIRWGDQDEIAGRTTYFRGVVYDDMTKVDYTIWPLELLDHVASLAELPDDLDVGYRVLLDKDQTTSGWKAPTYRAFTPSRPLAAEYRALVEEFWWDVTYAAKYLVRDELVFAKYILEQEMGVETLIKMLSWQIELTNEWSIPLGRYGRGLKARTPADTWSELEATYVGPGLEQNWAALFGMIDLFRRVAQEVGEALGYRYPHEIDDLVTAHARAMKAASLGRPE